MSYALRLLMQEILGAAKGYATAAVAPFTVGGKLNRGTPNAVGQIPAAGGGTGHDQGAEPPLGNPAGAGYVLSSTTGGVRLWVPQVADGAGAMVPLDPTTAQGDLLYRNPHGATTIAIGYLGDSITDNNPPSGAKPPARVSALLTAHGLTVTDVNQAHAGYAISDFQPGSTFLTDAKTAFAAAGVRLVHMAFGTNSAHAGALVSVADFRTQMLATIADLVAAGYLVAVSYPPWVSTVGTVGGWPWDATSQARLVAFQVEIDSLCNGVTVFQGDTGAYDAFVGGYPALLWDGVHPSDAGATLLAGLWANALRPYVRALTRTLALDRIPIGGPGTYLQVNGAGTGYQFGTPSGGGGGVSYAWEPLVTGGVMQGVVTTDGTTGDPIWANNDYVMVGTPYTPN